MRDKDIEILKGIKRRIKKHSHRPTCVLSYIFTFSNTRCTNSIKKFIETIDQHNIDRENCREVTSPSFLIDKILNHITEYVNSRTGIEKDVDIMAILGCNNDTRIKILTGRILSLKRENTIGDDTLLILFMYCNNIENHKMKIRKSDVYTLFNSIGNIKVKKIDNVKFDIVLEAKEDNNMPELKKEYHFRYLTSFEVVKPVYMQLELEKGKWIRL